MNKVVLAKHTCGLDLFLAGILYDRPLEDDSLSFRATLWENDDRPRGKLYLAEPSVGTVSSGCAGRGNN